MGARGKPVIAGATKIEPASRLREVEPFISYHRRSVEAGDVDPSNEMLAYVCRRFELHPEQRAWLAFLFSTCYCGATVFYVYNEFPDAENVDLARFRRWWAASKRGLLFQTDRRRVQTQDQLPRMVKHYQQATRRAGAVSILRQLASTGNKTHNYQRVRAWAEQLYYMGRFSLFLYTDALKAVLPELDMEPPTFADGDATSSLNGLALAIGRPELLHGKGMAGWTTRTSLSPRERRLLQSAEREMQAALSEQVGAENATAWQVETTLCAYKKYVRNGARYVGYYLDRQAQEIRKMQQEQPDGVCWRVLWEYRAETYGKEWLWESRQSAS